MKSLGERLKVLRNERGLVQQDMADFLKCRVRNYQAIEAEKLAQQLQQLNEDVWFVGDGVAAFADVFTAALGTRCHFADGNLVLPRAGALAMLAAQKAEQGQFDDLFQTELIYIRKSEAEVQWEARHQNL